MSKTPSKNYTDLDRSDFQALNAAIQKALLVQVDSTLSAIELGAYLKEVKDRSLWKIEEVGGRGSFYRWVSQRHQIRTTMIKNYLVIGAALTKDEVAGRRISVKSLQVISRAEERMRSFLIRLADAEQSSTKVKRALLAAREALALGASQKEAEEQGEAALTKTPAKTATKKPIEPTLEEALRRALARLEAVSQGQVRNMDVDLDQVEKLAQDLLTTVQKLKGTKDETKPVTPEPVTAVTDPLDADYLLRLPRPKTAVPLSVPPEVPAVSKDVVDRIEPCLVRIAALLEGQKLVPKEQMEACIDLAAQALEIAKSAVGGQHPLLIRPLEWLGFLAHCGGDRAYAERTTREILAIWQKYDTKDQGQILEWQSCLGLLLYRMGRIAEAQSLFTLVYHQRSAKLPKDHPLRKQAEENLLLVIPNQGSPGYFGGERAVL